MPTITGHGKDSAQFRISIPKELILAKGWKKGNILRFVEMVDGTVILKKLK